MIIFEHQQEIVVNIILDIGNEGKIVDILASHIHHSWQQQKTSSTNKQEQRDDDSGFWGLNTSWFLIVSLIIL